MNCQLLKQGHARVYDSSFEKRERFYATESDAQARELCVLDRRNVKGTTLTSTPHDVGRQ